MVGGPRSQHVTGNTSRQNQPQSAIIQHSLQNVAHYTGHSAVVAYAVICSDQLAMNGIEKTQIFHWIWFTMGNGPCIAKRWHYIWLCHDPGPFYYHGVTLITSSMCNNIRYNEWGKNTYPFQNFNSATVEVWEWIGSSHTLLDMWLLIYAGIKFNPCQQTSHC